MKKRISYYFSAISITIVLFFCSVAHAQAAPSDSPIYNNVFISYFSPDNATAVANYANQQKLGGYILWEFRGDMPYSDKTNSLLAALQPKAGYSPTIMGYWTNWSMYTDNSTTRAIPQPPYPVPGSIDPISGNTATNPDFTGKLEGMNVVAYSFLEAQTKDFTYYDSETGKTITILNQTPGKIGTLYFNDPWTDLLPTDKSCDNSNPICSFSLQNRYKSIPFSSGAKMGNFEAFAALKHSDIKNPLDTLKKVISVGGYGHDNTFEETFDNSNGITNFVTSATQIINTYNIDGIDLDYENPNMTHEQSQQYLNLITALRTALPNKFISITILANPAYLQGQSNENYGFDAGVLSKISGLVNHVNLMTYDFHGAFDYNPNGTGITGFLSNLYMPDNAPLNYKFSIDTSVDAATKQGIPVSKISVGIPAYGRALANIDAINGGLFQLITANASIPRGDLDTKSCSTLITPMGPNTCSGSFEYNFIMNNMVGHGFTAQPRTAKGVSNGITAYATQWSPPLTSKPVVYSYWAGWANADIPNFSFNGLILAFALMESDGQGNYKSDYSASGNFQLPAGSGPYVTWNNWVNKFLNSGARSYVSFGGGTNIEFRSDVINANDAELSNMANVIKKDVATYYFGGVDLDIENWWSYNAADNQKFATHLVTLVTKLRTLLDNDPATKDKPIVISVGWNSAGQVAGMNDGGSSYTGTMLPFYKDSNAMKAISSVNIMSYNTGIPDFYSRHDLIGNILSVYNNAGVPKQKLIIGVQPYESGGSPATPLSVVVTLGQFIKANNYGGLFLWGIGTPGIGKLSSWDYINAMKTGLGLN